MEGIPTARVHPCIGLRRTKAKLRKLIRDFEFGPLHDPAAARENHGFEMSMTDRILFAQTGPGLAPCRLRPS